MIHQKTKLVSFFNFLFSFFTTLLIVANKRVHRIIKPQLNALCFGTAISERNVSLPEIVFHLICLMPIPGKTLQTSYILAINNTVKQ